MANSRHFNVSNLSRVMLVIALVAVCTATVEARRMRHRVNVPDVFYGIDSAGNVDFEGDTYNARGKVIINTRSYRVATILRGRVHNDSRRRFQANLDSMFEIPPELSDLIPPEYTLEVDRAKYKVSRRGRARLSAMGHLEMSSENEA